MVTKLESIRGGGGSIRVGTVGTVGSLMTRELALSDNQSSGIPSRVASLRRCHGHISPRTCMDIPTKHRNSTSARKPPSKDACFPNNRRNHQNSFRIPMLNSDNISSGSTPVQDKPMKKRSNLVDIGCRNSTGALSSRLKKLGFSKMSQSLI